MTAHEKLLWQYGDSLKRLLRRIQRLETAGRWAGVERRMVREISRAVNELDTIAAKQMNQIIIRAWENAVDKTLSALNVPVSLGGGLNKTAMQLLAENAVDLLAEANHQFGRRWTDNLRRIGLDMAAEKLSTAQTIRETKSRMLERLQAEGFTAVTDSAGRTIRLTNYAAMVSRTTTREATNAATVQVSADWNCDLVKVVTKNACCGVCAVLRERVFSISGTDARFPPLNTVHGFKDGFKTIHPNCTCVLVPVVWELAREEEKARYLKRSAEPMDIDPRTAAEVERYNAGQKKKRESNRDRHQYERYKARLGDYAPKSFSGFRAMKRANSESWQALQKEYRIRNAAKTAAATE